MSEPGAGRGEIDGEGMVATAETSPGLGRAEAAVAALFQQSLAGALLLDGDGAVIVSNAAARERFAKGAGHGAELVGTSCNQLLCAKGQPCDDCPTRRAVREGVAVEREFRIWTGGRYRFVHALAVPVPAAEGQPANALLWLTDVSDLEVLRRSESAFRSSEQRAKALFDYVPAGVAVLKLDGALAQANAALCAMLGTTQAGLTRQRFSDLLHADDRASAEADRAELVRGAKPAVERDLRLSRRDGSSIDAHAISVLQRDGEGEPVCILVFVEDRSATGRLSRDAARQRTRFESLVATIDGIVWEADAQTLQFSFVGARAEAILGFPVERWLHQPRFWRNRLHPDDLNRVMQGYAVAATRGKGVHEFEYRMVAADGRVVRVHDRFEVARDDDGTLRMRGVLVDLDARAGSSPEVDEPDEPDPVETSEIDLGTLLAGMDGELQVAVGGSIDLVTELNCAATTVAARPREIRRSIVELALSVARAMEGRGRLSLALDVIETDGRATVAGEEAIVPGRYARLVVREDTRIALKRRPRPAGPRAVEPAPASVREAIHRLGGRLRERRKPGASPTYEVWLRLIG